VKYWPGDGRGNFAACRGTGCTCSENGQITPGASMILPTETIPTEAKGWRIGDLSGDGYADLVAIGDDGIRVYLNTDGFLLGEPIFFDGPTLFPGKWQLVQDDIEALKISFADMNGNGIADLVLQLGSRVLTLDLFRRAQPLGIAAAAYAPRPGLLISIDNGLGAKTEIAYETTAELARSAIAAGAPWAERIPQVMQVVGRITTSTTVPGDQPARMLYTYDDPAWDGFERRFRGFRTVTATRIGSPSLHTRTTYFIPKCPNHECWSEDHDFRLAQAVSGGPLITETFDGDGRYLSTVSRSYDIKEVMLDSRSLPVRFAYPMRVDTRIYDTNRAQTSTQQGVVEVTFGDRDPLATAPVPIRSRSSVLIRTSQKMDLYGNTLVAIDHGRIKDDGAPVDDPIRTASTYFPPRPDWKFLAKTSTIDPFPARPSIPADHERKESFSYDPWGRLTEVKAWLTGVIPLDRRHEAGAAVAPAPPAASQNSSWVSTARYTYDQYDNLLEDRGPSGRCTVSSYEGDFAQLPARVVRYRTGCGSLGTGYNSVITEHRWDRGFELPTYSTGPNGTMSRIVYDGFGRQNALFLPDPKTGQLEPEPWVRYFYDDIAGGPAQRVRMVVYDSPSRSRTEWSYTDGKGRGLLSLVQADPAAGDGGAWVVNGLPQLDSAGRVTGMYEPWYYNGDPAAHPLTQPASPMRSVARDSFGRVVEAKHLDGSFALPPTRGGAALSASGIA
jgi:hypothetical protein